MPLSKKEQQDLINKLLPDSGYEVDPEPQRDAMHPTAPAERTADEDSLSQMYPTQDGGDAQPTPKPGKAPMRDSQSQLSKSAPEGAGNRDNGDNEHNSDPPDNNDEEDDVVMLGQEDASPGSRARPQSDTQGSNVSGDHDEVYFIPVKGGDAPSDGGRGPGRKVIVATKKGVRGFQG